MDTHELTQKLKDEEYLKSKGYKWVTCDKCNGTGWSKKRIFPTPCFRCGGSGGNWQGPIIK